MKNKIGFGIYFLSTLFIFFVLPIKESQLTGTQQIHLLYGFSSDDIYVIMSSILYFWFDYLTLMMPLQGLLDIRRFIQIRPVKFHQKIALYFGTFSPFFIAFFIVKCLGLLFVSPYAIWAILIAVILWWLLLLILSTTELSTSYTTIIVIVSLVSIRLFFSII